MLVHNNECEINEQSSNGVCWIAAEGGAAVVGKCGSVALAMVVPVCTASARLRQKFTLHLVPF